MWFTPRRVSTCSRVNTPGMPVPIDRKGLADARPGDLVSVTPGRGRARVERVIGPADRIENVLEALLVEEGLRADFEPFDPKVLDGSAWQVLPLRPPASKAGALLTELHADVRIATR